MLCFRKFPVTNKLLDERGGENIKFFHTKKFVSQFRKKSRENLLVFHKLRAAKNVRVERGRAVLDFPSKLICLRVTKHFSKEPFCDAFPKKSGSEKVMPQK